MNSLLVLLIEIYRMKNGYKISYADMDMVLHPYYKGVLLQIFFIRSSFVFEKIYLSISQRKNLGEPPMLKVEGKLEPYSSDITLFLKDFHILSITSMT